jgi:hypothetical protein
VGFLPAKKRLKTGATYSRAQIRFCSVSPDLEGGRSLVADLLLSVFAQILAHGAIGKSQTTAGQRSVEPEGRKFEKEQIAAN